MENILSLLIWIPILGAIVVAFLPRDKDNLIRYTSAVVTGLQFVFAIVLWKKFDLSDGSMQFMEKYEWIPSLNISYILGVDGLSLPMVLLTGMLFFIGVFVSWNIVCSCVPSPEVVRRCSVRPVRNIARRSSGDGKYLDTRMQ